MCFEWASIRTCFRSALAFPPNTHAGSRPECQTLFFFSSSTSSSSFQVSLQTVPAKLYPLPAQRICYTKLYLLLNYIKRVLMICVRFFARAERTTRRPFQKMCLFFFFSPSVSFSACCSCQDLLLLLHVRPSSCT